VATKKRTREEGGKTVVTSALLSVSEAAQYLGVSRKKIYQLVEWGEIKAVKLGRAVQIQKDSLDQFRASGKLT
jgi:excisionase family DNA binding protein